MSVPVLGNFQDDSVLTDGHILTTTVTFPDQTTMTSGLDLNTIVGNNNGVFSWGASGFLATAKDIQIVDGHQLQANLMDSNGQWAPAIMYIGSQPGTDVFGKKAILHYAALVDSTVHLAADTNEQADAMVQVAAKSVDPNLNIQTVKTLRGDASTHWPDPGNAPAAGNRFSKPPWETASHFALMIVEAFFRMIL